MTRVQKESAPIFLVGFMGCGKSAVARELAELVQHSFVDLDDEIVRTSRESIPDLIAARGEAEFRRIESECLRTVSSRECLVVATGGGVVLDEKNRDLMHKRGTTVWLDAPFELCWERIDMDRTARPLAPDRETALARFNERLKFYQSADIQLAIDDSMTALMIAECIVDRLPQG
jgi:shikimate kinase